MSTTTYSYSMQTTPAFTLSTTFPQPSSWLPTLPPTTSLPLQYHPTCPHVCPGCGRGPSYPYPGPSYPYYPAWWTVS